MKIILIPLLLTLSITFSNDSLIELNVNDTPIWLDIPLQSISEDCAEGCTDNLFSFDLEPFVDDPDGDELTILEPILISGEIEELYVTSFILNIKPAQDFFGNIVIELTADDGELTATTEMTLNVEAINDTPIWLDIPLQSISEDCAEGCTDNLFSFDLEPFVDDPDGDELILLGPLLISGEIEQLYVASFILYVTPLSNFFGDITIQLTIDDGELSASTEFALTVESVNDIPYFSNLGDITIDEDQTYNDNWAFDISSGADNEEQNVFFIVTFDNLDLIESYTLTPNGVLTITPVENAYGQTDFEVYAQDEESFASDTAFHTLTINPINDLPIINDQFLITYDEDCSDESCNDTNKLILDIEMFDVYDVEDDTVLLTLYIDHDNINEHYTTDGNLGILIDQNYNSENEGVITVPVYITDSEEAQSEVFDCDIVINPINDIPYFSNLGDITIDEDQTYNDNWAFDISPGADNEEQNVFFIVTFDNLDLIESYSLLPSGEFTIVPAFNAFGNTLFSIQIMDSEFSQSEIYTHTLTINPINDFPIINDQSFIIYDEDCSDESCNDTNKLILDIEMFDVYDVEDDTVLLTLYIDHDNINEHYTTDGNLGILIDQNYNSENEGVITVPVYITDSEEAQSEVFDCDIVINPINDIPYFSNLGDITIDEDQTYNDNWAFDISTGAYNEDQQLFFTLTFDNPDLIESYTLTPNGVLIITPVENAYGQTDFEVYAQDEEFFASDTAFHTLTINPINDFPIINDQSFIIYDEDCSDESCNDTNKLILDIEMFDVYDVEDDTVLLTLYIDHDNINEHYTTDGNLGILIDQNYNSENEGVITVPVYITDSEEAQSEVFDCDIVINPINDIPYFSNLGDITINEDNTYYQNWAFDISAGAYNENQDLFFTLTFDNPDLIESYILDSEGYFSINPNEHANGESLFTIYLTDEQFGESEVTSNLLTINPVNDPPLFEFNPSFYNVDEDSGEHSINWAFNINPGGGNGQYKETDQQLIFVIENTYDQTLFNIFPEILINEENQGLLSFSLDEDMNGSTSLTITLQDDGDNKLNDDDDTNDGFNISENVDFPIQINQINDIPVEFSLFSDLRNYQIDETTFYTSDNGNIYFRYPYQSTYIDNQLENKLRFEWEWVDSLDIDIYSTINKDIKMEYIYYRLEAVESSNSNNVIILADSLIYNISNPDRDYEVDTQNNMVRIDLDLNTINGLDLSGKTSYHWRVIAQNYQLDYQDSDPSFYSEDENYSFYVDITLPIVNMIPLYDDIFSENFDLYLLSQERLIDFDGYNRPIKLWVDYGNDGSDEEILFPNEIDTLNYIYYLPHNFSNSGDIRLKYQMRDHVQNINASLEDISFGIINPIYNSTINFFNGLVILDIPKYSVDNQINCLIRNNYQFNEVYNNLDMIGDVIEIYPNDMQLINESHLSFDLNVLNSLYDDTNLSIYKLDSDIWYQCDTYIETHFLKTNINQFGSYAIFYSENHQTQTLLPSEYILKQNYPNPFNPNTTIDYYMPEANNINLVIYNLRGEKVRNLYSGYLNSGYHSTIWDGKSDSRFELPSGIYIVSFSFDSQIMNSKVVKIK